MTSSVDYQTLAINRMRNPNISTEILGNLQPKLSRSTAPPKESESKTSEDVDTVDGSIIGGKVILGDFETDTLKENVIFSDPKSLPVKIPIKPMIERYSKDEQSKNWINTKSYALATLDGTIMLVKDEIILWAMQVDRHISALCRLDVTGDGSDDIVACAWDGATYILDQQKNSVRFQFEEPVRAFCAGMYTVNAGTKSPSLVYNTFNGKVSTIFVL